MKRSNDTPVIVVEKSDGLGAFLWGLALGAGVALLFAPQTGDETRRMLRQRGRRLWAAAEEKAVELQDLLTDSDDEPEDEEAEDEAEGAERRVGGRSEGHSARDELERRLSQARHARSRSRRPAADAEPEG
jgi:gas vesicle protein